MALEITQMLFETRTEVRNEGRIVAAALRRWREQINALSSTWIRIVPLESGVLARNVLPAVLFEEFHPLATELRQGGRAVHRDLDRLLTGGLLAP